MKTFKQHLREAALEGDGDCFVVAGKIITASYPPGPDIDLDQAWLVHALVYGQGELQGMRFAHAWIEANGQVYDYSNGNAIEVDSQLYYAIGNIDHRERGAYAAYSKSQALKMLVRHEHWGPWELDQSKEGVVEGAANSDRLVLPNSRRKVGNKRVRLDPREITGL